MAHGTCNGSSGRRFGRHSYGLGRMKKRRIPGLIAGLFLLCAVTRGQTAPATSQKGAGSTTPDSWSFSATVDGYVVPHQEFYASPVFTADRSWLHLEAR